MARLPGPGCCDPRKIEAEHHAHVEQRLIAYRPSGQQVLNGFFVAIGGIGEFSLRDLLFDHRRADECDRSGRFCISAHARLPYPKFSPAKGIGTQARLSSLNAHEPQCMMAYYNRTAPAQINSPSMSKRNCWASRRSTKPRAT